MRRIAFVSALYLAAFMAPSQAVMLTTSDQESMDFDNLYLSELQADLDQVKKGKPTQAAANKKTVAKATAAASQNKKKPTAAQATAAGQRAQHPAVRRSGARTAGQLQRRARRGGRLERGAASARVLAL